MTENQPHDPAADSAAPIPDTVPPSTATKSPWHHNGHFVAALLVLALFAGGGIGYAIALNDVREAVRDAKAHSRHYEGKKRSHSRPEVRREDRSGQVPVPSR